MNRVKTGKLSRMNSSGLPKLDPSQFASPQLDAPQKETSPAPARRFNILLIENDAELVQTMSTLLNRVAECQHAPSGAEGWAKFEAAHPDLILLSVALPDSTGFHLCRQIRQKSTVPIIMMTKERNDQEELQGLKDGADAFIAEPWNTQLMVANVMAQLRRVYSYDHQARQNANNEEAEEIAPPGWATCESCGYMAPQQRFEKENALGENMRVCPHCGETEQSVAYTIA